MMKSVLLIQLPIPPLAFGTRTANVPLAAACLKQSAEPVSGARIDILPERLASYLGDAALEREIIFRRPDIVGFTVFNWNLCRSLELARKLKEATGCSIIFGGPEITPDNPLIESDAVDLLIYGEGEAVLADLLRDHPRWPHRRIAAPPDPGFRLRPSPYLSGLLDPETDGLVYLETQRGCPHHCGFCYYNKSRGKTIAAEDDRVVEGIRWAIDRDIGDLCIIDPSFDSRPGLKTLLERIAEINPDRRISLNAEIRAETVTPELADRYAAAGFTFFEIGLQSTNPEALAVMRRRTDPARFLRGTRLLKERGIIPRIDMIIGLPGDTPDGFRESLSFVAENGLSDDVQVFPLSVLPGTDFRFRSNELGLAYAPSPPYTVLQTPAFSTEAIAIAFDQAETSLDVSLFPPPGLDLAYIGTGNIPSDIGVRIGGKAYVRKVLLDRIRPSAEIASLAGHLTFPYQVMVDRSCEDAGYLYDVIGRLSNSNPHTPFEVIFLEPKADPDVSRLLSAICIKRPHYLDIYNLYQFSRPGNRAVLFTLVSSRPELFFQGEMKRQVYRYMNPVLPEPGELMQFAEFDGILIDPPLSAADVASWQDRTAPLHEELPYISFSKTVLQERWNMLTPAENAHRFSD